MRKARAPSGACSASLRASLASGVDGCALRAHDNARHAPPVSASPLLLARRLRHRRPQPPAADARADAGRRRQRGDADRPDRQRARSSASARPALQVREGTGLKLQFRGAACVLDAYLYPPASGAGVAARHPCRRAAAASGADIDQRDCIAALSRRAEARASAHSRGFGDHRVGIVEMRAAPSASSAGSPLLPAAIRQLRTIRLRPMRLIGEPANISRKPASSSASRSASRGAASSARGRKARLAARRLGEAVPRADRQAIVAAVDAVADRLAELAPGSAPDARSSGRKCSAAHRAGRAPGRRRSGRRRGSACSCRNAAASRGASGSSSRLV